MWIGTLFHLFFAGKRLGISLWWKPKFTELECFIGLYSIQCNDLTTVTFMQSGWSWNQSTLGSKLRYEYGLDPVINYLFVDNELWGWWHQMTRSVGRLLSNPFNSRVWRPEEPTSLFLLWPVPDFLLASFPLSSHSTSFRPLKTIEIQSRCVNQGGTLESSMFCNVHSPARKRYLSFSNGEDRFCNIFETRENLYVYSTCGPYKFKSRRRTRFKVWEESFQVSGEGHSKEASGIKTENSP